MTEAEFTTALAQLNQLETEKTKSHQAVLASIAAAKKQNDTTRSLQQQMAALDPPIENLKAQTQAYVNEQNAIRRKEAEAKEAEAAAAKAKEASELEVAKARIAELEAAAKE